MHENFEYYLKNYGPIDNDEPADAEVIGRISRIYPPSLAGFIAEFGFPSFHSGLFRLCDPEDFRSILAMIFKADPDFSHRDCHVVGYSAFGVLKCWSPKYYGFDIELPLGAIYCSALTMPDWNPTASADHMASSLVPDNEDVEFFDFNGEPMFARCLELYGKLRKGECYGFVPALAISGPYSPLRRVENIKRVSALEHFSILSQLEDFSLMKITPSDVVPLRKIG